MRIQVWMSETVFYNMIIEVPDDATDEQIAAAAEEEFVQGNYNHGGQDDRKVDDWQHAEGSPPSEEENVIHS